MLLNSPLMSHATAVPDADALCVAGRCYSWSDLTAAIRKRASTFSAAGIGRQTVVAHDLPSGFDWVVDFHALLWVGAVPILFSADITDAEFAARAPIAGVSVRTSMIARHELDTDATEQSRDVEGHPDAASWSLNLPLFGVWTSGTTGTPKLVEISAQQAIFSAIGAFSRLGISSQDRWLLAMPLHHVGGVSILLRSAIFGCSVELHEQFDASACNRSIDRGDATVFSAVPQMLERMLDERDERPFASTLRAIMLGGAATSDELLQRLQRVDAPIALTWGMSETGSHVATNSPRDYRSTLAPVPFMRIRESHGTLCVRGPLAPYGELETSDRGRVEDGRVSIDGRADRVIISGGENIDLERVAQIFSAYDRIQEVSVVGLPNDRWGARPHLAYRADQPVAESELRAFGRARLERFEIPDSFTFLDTIPRNATGKIDHRSLATALRERLTPS